MHLLSIPGTYMVWLYHRLTTVAFCGIFAIGRCLFVIHMYYLQVYRAYQHNLARYLYVQLTSADTLMASLNSDQTTPVQHIENTHACLLLQKCTHCAVLHRRLRQLLQHHSLASVHLISPSRHEKQKQSPDRTA